MFLLTRRDALAGLASAAARTSAPAPVVVFDAFALFDPSNVEKVADAIVPGRGEELAQAWRRKHFEYAWWSALAGNFESFDTLGRKALLTTVQVLGLRLDEGDVDLLFGTLGKLPLWPDVKVTLETLRTRGARLAVLSNLSRQTLESAVRNAAIGDVFERLLSTELCQTYKPDRRAYSLAVRHLGREPADIRFVAYAGWDAYGAAAFGMPVYWANRAKVVTEKLQPLASRSAPDLRDLIDFTFTAHPPDARLR